MKKHYMILTIMYLCGVFGLLGCNGQTKSTDNRSYLLQVTRPETAPSSKTEDCFFVRHCRVANAFSGRQFVYRITDVQYEQDFYKTFMINPDAQFTDAVRQWFKDSAMFGGLAQAEYIADTCLIVPYVREFYTDFRAKESPKAVIVMDVQLRRFNGKTNDSQPLFEKTYSAQGTLPPLPAAEQIVQACSQALSQIMQKLENDTAAALNKTP